MAMLTANEPTSPIQTEYPPKPPKAPSPASAPATMNPTPSTTKNPAARGSHAQNPGRSSRSTPQTVAIITSALRLRRRAP